MLRRAHRTLRAAGGNREAALLGSLLARIAAQQGRFDEADEQLAQAREAVGERDALWAAQIDSRAAECLALAGRIDDTLAAVDGALRAAAEWEGLCPQVPAFHRLRGWALARLGRGEEAEAAFAASTHAAVELAALHEEAATAYLASRMAPQRGELALVEAARAAALHDRLGIVAPLQLPIDAKQHPIELPHVTSILTRA
jgi:predicted negative regulator of RcsB-dependent stress response